MPTVQCKMKEYRQTGSAPHARCPLYNAASIERVCTCEWYKILHLQTRIAHWRWGRVDTDCTLWTRIAQIVGGVSAEVRLVGALAARLSHGNSSKDLLPQTSQRQLPDHQRSAVCSIQQYPLFIHQSIFCNTCFSRRAPCMVVRFW